MGSIGHNLTCSLNPEEEVGSLSGIVALPVRRKGLEMMLAHEEMISPALISRATEAGGLTNKFHLSLPSELVSTTSEKEELIRLSVPSS